MSSQTVASLSTSLVQLCSRPFVLPSLSIVSHALNSPEYLPYRRLLFRESFSDGFVESRPSRRRSHRRRVHSINSTVASEPSSARLTSLFFTSHRLLPSPSFDFSTPREDVPIPGHKSTQLVLPDPQECWREWSPKSAPPSFAASDQLLKS
jgi:hypothetical protein